jgi:superfamily II DNA or RNA helicase
MSYKSIIKQRGLSELPYQKEFLTNPKYSNNKKPIVVGMGTSAGKTITTLMKLEMFYSEPTNKKHKTLLVPASKTILRDNFETELLKFNPSFNYCVCKSKRDLIDSIRDKGCNVIVVLPQTLLRNYESLPKIHTFILDEAHEWYFKQTIQSVLDWCKPTQQYLLTGTPSNFIAEGSKFEFMLVPVMELYELGLVSNVKIEVVSSTYQLSNKDFNSEDNLKNGITNDSKMNTSSLDKVLKEMLYKLGYENSRLSNTTISQMFNELDKTILFCNSIEQSDTFYKKLSNIKGLKNKVLLSHSESDSDSELFMLFKNDSNMKLLICVDRGRIGFNIPELMNIIDFSFTQNLNTMLQMYGRLLRISNSNKRKVYYKVSPKGSEEWYMTLVEGMLTLTDIEGYSTYNGTNKNGIKIKTKRNKSGNYIGNFKPTMKTKKLGFELDLQFLTKVNEKMNGGFDTIAETTLGEVRNVFYGTTNQNRDRSLKEVIKICNSYTLYNSFVNEQQSIKSWLSARNLLEKYTSHMKRLKNYYDTKECLSLLKSFKGNKSSFCKKHNGEYQHLKAKGYWIEKYTKHLSKDKVDINEYIELWKSFVGTKQQFGKQYVKAYGKLSRTGLLKTIKK